MHPSTTLFPYTTLFRSGVEVLRAAKKVDQDILGIMITAFASTETAVEAMRLGACDYLSKPFDIDLLKMKVREKDRKSTRLNSSHRTISYAVFCLKKKKK